MTKGIKRPWTHRGPENESSLYRVYGPEQVIKGFRYEGESYTSGCSFGATQLVKSIHHSRSFTLGFTMQANRELELLNALRKDLFIRLGMPGLTVTAINKEADGEFTYKYATANGGGSISVQAPTGKTAVRRYPVRSDLDDVKFTIALEETWTRPKSETQWWMKRG